MLLAIDFETALGFGAVYGAEPVQAACSIGVAKINERGEPQLVLSSFVRPDPFMMDPGCEEVHGISLHQLSCAPTFEELWHEKLNPLIAEADILTAHNFRFDGKVLKQSLRASNIRIPVVRVFDTLDAVRRYWPIKHHNLAACCEYIHYPLNHHEAGSDAVGCAAVFKRLWEEGYVKEFGWL